MKHKLQRFLKAFFWWDNPKAGALFGTLVVTIVGILLSVFAACFTLSNDLGVFCRTWAYSLFVVLASLVIGLLVYAAILMWHYATFLARHRVGLSLWKSVVWGFTVVILPLGIFTFWLPCLVKLRERKALKLFAGWFLLTCVTVAFSIALKLPNDHVAMCAANVPLLALWVMMLMSISDVRRVGRWAYLPPVLLALWHLCVIALNLRLDACVARHILEEQRESRSSLTWEEAFHTYTNGVSVSDEPYSILMSEEMRHILKASYPKDFSPWHFSDEEIETVEACMQSNAVFLAEIDRVLMQEPPVCFTPTNIANTGFIEYPSEFSAFLEVSKFYHMESTRAWRKNDAQGVIDADLRIQALQRYFDRSLDFFYWMVLLRIEHQRPPYLSRTLAILPDSALEQLKTSMAQRDFRERDDRVRRIIQMQLFTGATQINYVFRDAVRKKTVWYVDIWGLEKRSVSCSVLRLWWRYEQLGLLKYYTQFFLCRNQGQYLWDSHSCPVCENLEDRLPFISSIIIANFDGRLRELRYTLDIQDAFFLAITVEQYRRKHQNLPETLETLVPEFLDAIPISRITEKPFEYTAGTVSPPYAPKILINGYSVSNGGDEQKRALVGCVVPLHSQETHEHENGR
ncbi:MAG: hypothetical protein FWH21_04725 [Kiritimatiellaeota bacterium]|nr:hypothetical protein [Kiritimatiellota bacterium]